VTSVADRQRELEEARIEASTCRRCELYRDATQTVFGEGPALATLMIVGEQPGDQEDEAGRPFVGRAGALLRRLLEEAGIDERGVYVTNAVKHFKWRPKGTRRIHDKPSWSAIRACDHWLWLELGLVRPDVLVCLGSTAAQALLGRDARVTAMRGRVQSVPELAPAVVVTFHPSAVLRGGDRRGQLREQALHDLELARDALPG
jgi:DNA polymerase